MRKPHPVAPADLVPHALHLSLLDHSRPVCRLKHVVLSPAVQPLGQRAHLIGLQQSHPTIVPAVVDGIVDFDRGTFYPVFVDRLWGQSFGQFLFQIEKTSDEMDKADAIGWLVVVVDNQAVARGEEDCVMGCYGIFHSPEQALVEAGKQDADSKKALDEDDLGWTHLVKPLYPDNYGVDDAKA